MKKQTNVIKICPMAMERDKYYAAILIYAPSTLPLKDEYDYRHDMDCWMSKNSYVPMDYEGVDKLVMLSAQINADIQYPSAEDLDECKKSQNEMFEFCGMYDEII